MGDAARAVRSGVQRDFIKKFEGLSGRYSVRQIWEDWVIMYAIAISNTVDKLHAEEREKQYMQRAQKYGPKEMQVFAELCADMVAALDVNPDQDFLGEMFMAVGMGSDKAGQFFTPYDVCRCMAEITTNPEFLQGQLEQKGWISVNDCACGAGALLVAFANVCARLKINYQTSVLFVAQDIDFLVGCMCYLQLSLLGCPGYVVIDNTITDPATSYDARGLIPRDKGNVWYTPMYFRQEWDMRRRWAMIDMQLQALGVSAPTEPLQRPETPVEDDPPVVISPEPERPAEAEIEAFEANEFGQLKFF